MEKTRINKDSENIDEVELEYVETVEIKKHYKPKSIKDEIKYLDESIENFQNQKAKMEATLAEVEGEIKKIKDAKKKDTK